MDFLLKDFRYLKYLEDVTEMEITPMRHAQKPHPLSPRNQPFQAFWLETIDCYDYLREVLAFTPSAVWSLWWL